MAGIRYPVYRKDKTPAAFIRPILKWAGGKRQLIPAIMPMIPSNFENYIEPFAGGCALLVELYNHGRIRHAIISDINGELINLYKVIKDSPEKLIDEIAGLPFGNSSISYYSARERYNGILGLGDSMIERAALFLYFNRHGYNGLWRVNASGKFNVPFGRYRNPAMPDPDHIIAFSGMLSIVDIYNCDFAETCSKASNGDLVYLDPPYFPINSTSSFTAYSSGGFPFSEQTRLRDECVEIGKKGARIIFNNSWSPEISSLYSGFYTVKIPTSRIINSNARKRSGYFDLLGSNFTPSGNESQEQ